jgi:hypothetical protein
MSDDDVPVITTAQKSMILTRLVQIQDETRRQHFIEAVAARLRLTGGTIADRDVEAAVMGAFSRYGQTAA